MRSASLRLRDTRSISEIHFRDIRIGQFTGTDSQPDGLNRYGDVAGNPTTATDPTGHRACCADSSVCSGGGHGKVIDPVLGSDHWEPWSPLQPGTVRAPWKRGWRRYVFPWCRQGYRWTWAKQLEVPRPS